MRNDYVMVYKHFGFTTQIPPAPVFHFTSKWKYVLLLLKILL